MDRDELVSFIRRRGLGVVATRSSVGAPEAALVGVAATDRAEIVFDTSIRSRKYRNIEACAEVAVVIGLDDEVTVQCEGRAEILSGEERDRCLATYVEQYPDGRERAGDADIALIRVTLSWVRHSDYRAGSFGIRECRLDR